MVPTFLASSPERESGPIGGFFELHEPDGSAPGESVLDKWTGGRPYTTYVNARSAFAALVGCFPEASIWLPAFLCRELIQPEYAGRLRFYPVMDGFEPDLAAVEEAAEAGDLVLVPAYFGRPISASLGRLASARPDLLIIEDRAQSLEGGGTSDAHWRLYSPRKLLGVADGGLLVSSGKTARLPRPRRPANVKSLWQAPRLRWEDPLKQRGYDWHAANQAKEAAMSASDEDMTRLSLSILARTSLDSLAARRRRNWRALDAHLRTWSALSGDPGPAPFGYVLRVFANVREHLLKGLHRRQIFATVHWRTLAGPPQAFRREHSWSQEIVTLPCDHRYTERDMDRVAVGVLQLLNDRSYAPRDGTRRSYSCS